MRITSYKRLNTFAANPIIVTIFILTVAGVLVNIQYNNLTAHAQSASPNLINNTLFVTTSAATQAKPDKVTVSLGVETTDTTAKAALTSNSNFTNKVLAELKAAGVQENETSTSYFTIIPNYDYSVSATQGRATGFTVSNSIQIDSNNLEKISEWIDTSVAAGANNVNNIYFSLSDEKLHEIKNSLIKDAISNAKTTADSAASAAGFKVMAVKSITVGDIGSAPPVPGPYLADSLPSQEASPPTPILSGQQEVSASVSIIYLLNR